MSDLALEYVAFWLGLWGCVAYFMYLVSRRPS